MTRRKPEKTETAGRLSKNAAPVDSNFSLTEGKGSKKNVPELLPKILRQESDDRVFGRRNTVGREIFVLICRSVVELDFRIE